MVGSKLVVEEPGRLTQILLGRLWHFGVQGPGVAVRSRHVEASIDHEFGPRRTHAVGVERVDDVVGGGPLLIGVGQQLQQRRLVGDERAYPGRMAGNQREPRDGASAGTEHVC